MAKSFISSKNIVNSALENFGLVSRFLCHLILMAGEHFVVETNHESLGWLMKLEKPARLVRWAIRLPEYDFSIKPKAGKLNTTADA